MIDIKVYCNMVIIYEEYTCLIPIVAIVNTFCTTWTQSNEAKHTN